MSKKKVLYIVDRLDADRPEAVVARIARGLDRERYEPFVCCLHKEGDLAEDLYRSVKRFKRLSHNLDDKVMDLGRRVSLNFQIPSFQTS